MMMMTASLVSIEFQNTSYIIMVRCFLFSLVKFNCKEILKLDK